VNIAVTLSYNATEGSYIIFTLTSVIYSSSVTQNFNLSQVNGCVNLMMPPFDSVANILPPCFTECYGFVTDSRLRKFGLLSVRLWPTSFLLVSQNVTVLLQIHGYVSLVVCLFGSVANSLNIAVLTRREMTSPTNALLTGLAVADLLVMLEYIPYACHMYMSQSNRPITDQFSYAWSTFVLFHSNFGQVIRLGPVPMAVRSTA